MEFKAGFLQCDIGLVSGAGNWCVIEVDGQQHYCQVCEDFSTDGGVCRNGMVCATATPWSVMNDGKTETRNNILELLDVPYLCVNSNSLKFSASSVVDQLDVFIGGLR